MKKGSIMSLESRQKMREAALGDGRRPPPFKGKSHSKDSIELMKRKQKGLKKHTEESKKKIGLAHSGMKNYFWKGGITSENMKIRKSTEYRDWRIAVFKRDNYTCVLCFEVGRKLNADHIKRFADYPELRFDLSNGRTLCEACHRKTPGFGRYAVWKQL